MGDVSIFYVHLVYFAAISHILVFGIFPGCLEYFSPFCYVVTRKSGHPAIKHQPNYLQNGIAFRQFSSFKKVQTYT
jgi:hypothetical protein